MPWTAHVYCYLQFITIVNKSRSEEFHFGDSLMLFLATFPLFPNLAPCSLPPNLAPHSPCPNLPPTPPAPNLGPVPLPSQIWLPHYHCPPPIWPSLPPPIPKNWPPTPPCHIPYPLLHLSLTPHPLPPAGMFVLMFISISPCMDSISSGVLPSMQKKYFSPHVEKIPKKSWSNRISINKVTLYESPTRQILLIITRQP